MNDARARLEALLLDAGDLHDKDLRAKLQWVEDAALAADALAADDDELARGALDLKAALGAALKLADSPMDDEALLSFEVVFKTLVGRGTATLFTALARGYGELARGRGPRRAEAAELARAFQALAKDVARGARPATETAQRIAAVKRTLDGG